MSDRRGIGLAGLIAGVAVLLVAMSMAVTAFYAASKAAKGAADFTRASNFTEGVMETVRSRPYDRIATMVVTSGLPDLEDAKCRIDVDPRGGGLKQITVVFSWLDGKRPREVKLSTLVAKGGSR